jgi:hypothetical protein
MKVKTKKGWETVPTESNWWTVFRNLHFLEREKIHDENGAVHDCVKLENGWTYNGGWEQAQYDNPPAPMGFKETTKIILYHAPEPP